MLSIKSLNVTVGDKPVLKNFTLDIPAGEIHAIMGPNGCGKSTLSYVLSGRPGYDITGGTVTFNGIDILSMDPHERVGAGIFLGFQYPVELPGVPLTTFIKTSVSAVRKMRGEDDETPINFLKRLKQTAATLGISDDMLKRGVNVGASGGEKKRNDMLQMRMLNPAFCILDEIDSGLDIDALKIVSDTVNTMRVPDRSFLLITHYQRLLDHITPDAVHVMQDGRIVETGDAGLARRLEQTGYTAYEGVA